ncbi:MAG: emp24/gp25L/p24 family protein [Chloroflexi bacterium]|nr:emp24/gp25L/p24 family protein [Chloroflexota bacterium]
MDKENQVLRIRKPYILIPLLMVLLTLAIVACGAKPTPTPQPKSYNGNVTVPPGEDSGIPITMEALNRLVGTINVQPLDAFVDMRFAIRDPFGNAVLNLGEVKGKRSFAVIAATDGTYQLYFVNAHDRIQERLVSYSVTVYHK